MSDFVEGVFCYAATGFTPDQLRALRGLAKGHAFLSATESGSADIGDLFARRLVELWNTGAGFTAWRLTKKGQAAITKIDATK